MNRSVMWDVGEMAADPLFGRIQICLCMLPVNCPSQALESRISQFSWSWSHWGLVKKMQCTISVSACCCFRQNQATVPNLFPQRWVRNMGFCSRFLVVWAKYSCRQPCYKVLYGTTGWSMSHSWSGDWKRWLDFPLVVLATKQQSWSPSSPLLHEYLNNSRTVTSFIQKEWRVPQYS